MAKSKSLTEKIKDLLLTMRDSELEYLEKFKKDEDKWEILKGIIENLDENIYGLIEIPKLGILHPTYEHEDELDRCIKYIEKIQKQNRFTVFDDTFKTVTESEVLRDLLEKSLEIYSDRKKIQEQYQSDIDKINTIVYNIESGKLIDITELGDFFKRKAARYPFEINEILGWVGYYNSLIYNAQIDNLVADNNSLNEQISSLKESQKKKLDRESVIEVFNLYDYKLSDFTDEEIDLLLFNGNLKDIEYILAMYNKYHIKLKKKKTNLQLLFLSNEDVIKKVIEICEQNDLDFKKIVSSYPSILFSDKEVYIPKSSDGIENIESSKFEDFCKNVELFSSCGKKEFIKNIDLLIKPNELIKDNINKLEFYDIHILDYKYDVAVSALQNPDVLSLVDRYIEAGYSTEFRVSTDSFQKDSDDIYFYQLYYFSINRIEPLNLNKNEIISKTGIIEPKINEVNYEKRLKKQLKNSEAEKYDTDQNSIMLELESDKYKLNDYIYNINGIYLSRLKALRVLNIISKEKIIDSNDILYALTYNTILNQNQFDLVKNEIATINRGRH